MNKATHPIEREELMAYLDGELSKDRAEATAAHLSECADCRGFVTELRGVSQALNAWDVGSADSPVSTAISAALEEYWAKRGKVPIAQWRWRDIFRRRWQSTAWVGALAAIALLAYVGSSVRYLKVSRVVEESRSREQPGDRDHLAVLESKGMTDGVNPPQGKQFDKLEQFAEVHSAPQVKFGAPQRDKSAVAREAIASGPMIIRTAQLALITKEFDNARSAVESILKRHHGYVGELKVGGSTGSGRALNATLRVPADQLDATLTELKTLGRVESETQSGQDVTSQYVDLQARLANARNTEQRLTDLLRQRTGKLSDVLEVGQEVDRVRGEIEQMEAERKNMSNQVSFATLNATITEDYKAQLQVVPPSTSTRLSNAAVEGYKSMVDGIVSLVLFLLEDGPTLLLWSAILFFPGRLVWKRVRRSVAHIG
jgi:hypothetical protein